MAVMSNPDTAATLTISRGDRVLIAGPGGVLDGGELGFYARDTRLVSRHRITLDGQPPELVEEVAMRFYSSRHVARSASPQPGHDGPPAGSLLLTVDRSVTDAVHEDLDLRNAGRSAARVELAVELDGDFADMFEVRGVAPQLERHPSVGWSAERSELRLDYRSGPFARACLVRCDKASSQPAFRDGRIVFEIALRPQETWHVCLHWIPILGSDSAASEAAGASTATCHLLTGSPPEEDGLPRGALTLRTTNPAVQTAWNQAVWDLETLRLETPESGGAVVAAAGSPWYLTLFGRDSIITALQAMPGYPELARGALSALAALQGDHADPARDMEPGKILHEIRHGELAERRLLPFQPYYGTHDATPLFVVLLARTFDWTGDAAMVERLLPAAEAAMGWIERYGDRDGDGFLEYATRSPHGFPNQGWKDDVGAIPHADGSLAPLPIALCEHQAYAYQARLALARLYALVGRDTDAARLRSDAAVLHRRFNETFWWEEEGTYYLGLDGNKEPIRSVASNAGHCLATGIVPPVRAERVVSRLMAEDMWSGWGIRTLAAGHPAYDPFSYHTGSVWPHDNAMIAAGFAAHGHRASVNTIASALFDAAAALPGHRLPELFSGLRRGTTGPPAPCPGSCVPQAWSASALFRMILLVCGIDVRSGPRGPRIHLDPDLPDWLPSVALEHVRVHDGELSVAIHAGTATRIENATSVPLVRGATSQQTPFWG